MKNLITFLIMILYAIWSYNTFSQEIPKPVGYVNDFADVLTTGEEKYLEAILKDYEEKSTVEIAVVTIQSLDGITIEEYAVKLVEQWGVGKKDKDNGLVIINSIQDRKWRIEVGYGLEEFITDAYAANIGDNYLTSNLKNAAYFEAYKQVVEQIMVRLGNLTDEDKQRITEENSEGFPTWFIILLIAIGIIFFTFLFMAVSYDEYNGTGGGFGGFGEFGSGGGFGGFGGGGSGGGGASGGYY